MGSAAGTGVRSFAEGGSTSTPTSAPTGEASAAPPRQIYRPQYEDYGLGSTPQAQGRLASILNMGNYGNQMPTYTRPSIPMQQPTYQIPSGPLLTPQQQISKVFGKLIDMSPNKQAFTAGLDRTPTGQALSKIFGLNTPPPPSPPANGYRVPYMTRAQYDAVNNQSDIGNRVIRARASQLSTDGSEGG